MIVWGLTFMILAAAAAVVSVRNVFRASLSLGVVLLGVAGCFLLLDAEFLAFVQILVYVGAILTLIVLAVMLTANLPSAEAPARSRPHRIISAAIALGLFVSLVQAVVVLAPVGSPSTSPSTLPALGQALITTFVMPFEVISLVFVAAMVGAIAVAFTPSHRATTTIR